VDELESLDGRPFTVPHGVGSSDSVESTNGWPYSELATDAALTDVTSESWPLVAEVVMVVEFAVLLVEAMDVSDELDIPPTLNEAMRVHG
jgi:hypothetical protein